jgi:ribosomal protein S18 acetylase RimI-like enzyme
VTRRANSVFPLDWEGTITVEDAVDQVRSFYVTRGIIPRFQMTRASQPEGLDESLGALGFVVELKVLIQVTSIDSAVATESDIPVEVHAAPSAEWFRAYADAGRLDEFSLRIRQEIMERVPAVKGFASAQIDGRIVGIGFGVQDGDWVGLFAIVTHTKYRRRGIATAVSYALTKWGQQQGATHAYLQVEEDNHAALKLYNRLGFKNHHRYWYRMLNPENEP